eukprot:GHRR01009377.1.p1 GENE.GHRR01009377.1~~GHRR01009377.1.p1  ORF type:complete len:261 (+),score=77.24 GHRR01009377.1:38-820(+)
MAERDKQLPTMFCMQTGVIRLNRIVIKCRILRNVVVATCAMSGKSVVNVEVVSDTVCPWCYIGKRRLEKAMKQFVDRADFKVHWLPFQLNPDAPQEGVNKMESYRQKFGASRVAQMVPAMTQTFANEGMQYSMGGLTGNTRNSHRLLAWAAAKHGLDRQNALAEELFKGYFTQERYINDRDFLLEAVEAAGLPRDEAAAILNTDGIGEQLVKEEIHKYPQVTGVPFFVVNGRQVPSLNVVVPFYCQRGARGWFVETEQVT